MKRDIICVTMTTWKGDYMKTIVHMMGNLAKYHNVLFVDYPFTYKDILGTIKTSKENLEPKKILGITNRLSEVEYKGNKLFHLSLPPVLPINWIDDHSTYDSLMALQSKKIAGSINKAATFLGFSEPVVINAFNPSLGYFLQGKLNASKTLYYCYDEIAEAKWCGKHGARHEQHFLKSVDHVLVTSKCLMDSKQKINANTTLVKNGVDFEMFNSEFFDQTTSNPRRVVGYLGSVDHRLDFDLLHRVIGENPDLTFRFVGRITEPEEAGKLKKYPNVELLGSKPPRELPAELMKFDAGIIPFVKSEFTRNIYPLKINEYLAAGKPVLSTEFTNMTEFESVVELAEAENFSYKLGKCMNGEKDHQTLDRIQFARSNDWSTRVRLLNEIIDEKAA